MTSVHDFEATTIDGRTERLDSYRGQVLLIVNVASRCGFTPQYAELESLYQRHRAAGFAVLGFPCDQFGHQEPGSDSEIKTFCTLNYGVTFPMFAKINVNGPSAHPLYRYLTAARPGILGTRAVKWNFTKFLVNRRGEAICRLASNAVTAKIEKELLPLLSDNSCSTAEGADSP